MRIIILFKPFAFFHCFILFRHCAIIIKPKEWKMKNCRSLPHQMFIPKSYFATLEAILRFKWSVYSLLVSVIQRLMDCKEAQIWSLDGALYILLAILLNICITLNNRPQLIRLSIAYLARYKQNYVLMLHGCYTFSCSFPTTLVTLHTVAEMFLPECFFIFFFFVQLDLLGKIFLLVLSFKATKLYRGLTVVERNLWLEYRIWERAARVRRINFNQCPMLNN